MSMAEAPVRKVQCVCSMCSKSGFYVNIDLKLDEYGMLENEDDIDPMIQAMRHHGYHMRDGMLICPLCSHAIQNKHRIL